jgi:hypothetical protein
MSLQFPKDSYTVSQSYPNLVSRYLAMGIVEETRLLPS